MTPEQAEVLNLIVRHYKEAREYAEQGRDELFVKAITDMAWVVAPALHKAAGRLVALRPIFGNVLERGHSYGICSFGFLEQKKFVFGELYNGEAGPGMTLIKGFKIPGKVDDVPF